VSNFSFQPPFFFFLKLDTDRFLALSLSAWLAGPLRHPTQTFFSPF